VELQFEVIRHVITDLSAVLACPVCLSSLNEGLGAFVRDLRCNACGRTYPVADGIAQLVIGGTCQDENEYEKEFRAAVDARPNLGQWFQKKSSEEQHECISGHFNVWSANKEFHDAEGELYEDDKRQVLTCRDAKNQHRIEKNISDLARRTGGGYSLDLGCGTGNVLKFSQKEYDMAVGVDVSTVLLKLAQQRCHYVLQADMVFLPFKSGSFSMASAFSVLHHLYDPTQVFIEVSRVLRRGGIFYSDWDPNKRDLVKARIRWRAFVFLQSVYRMLRRSYAAFRHPGDKKSLELDFLAQRPELQEVYALAEFREQGCYAERGINVDELIAILSAYGFVAFQTEYHSGGRSLEECFNDKSIPANGRWRLKVQQWLGYQPNELHENVMLVAQKGSE
jgi:SAM-dependent methyltransferase